MWFRISYFSTIDDMKRGIKFRRMKYRHGSRKETENKAYLDLARKQVQCDSTCTCLKDKTIASINY